MDDASTPSRLYVDWGKLGTIIAVLASTVALALAGAIGSDTVALVMGMAAGYTFGNGRLAAKGKSPQPMIGRRAEPGHERRSGDVP